MSSSSLIPDRQLTFSPDLAATIGLGEAILLQGIAPQIPQTPGRWHALVMTSLEKNFPFYRMDVNGYTWLIRKAARTIHPEDKKCHEIR